MKTVVFLTLFVTCLATELDDESYVYDVDEAVSVQPTQLESLLGELRAGRRQVWLPLSQRIRKRVCRIVRLVSAMTESYSGSWCDKSSHKVHFTVVKEKLGAKFILHGRRYILRGGKVIPGKKRGPSEGEPDKDDSAGSETGSGKKGLLDSSFENALKNAKALDAAGVRIEDEDLYEYYPGATHAKVVGEFIDMYAKYNEEIDQSLRKSLDYLRDDPDAPAQIKALEASFHNLDPANTYSQRLAQDFVERTGVRDVGGEHFELQGFGVGVSGGLSFFAGLLAGADVVFDFQTHDSVTGRAWAGLSVKTGISISLGLEFSFWGAQPLTGKIWGAILDLDIIIPDYPFLTFIRIMHIKQAAPHNAEISRPNGESAGYSVQLPFGIGFPLRKRRPHHFNRTSNRTTSALGAFIAQQYAFKRNKAATLSVTNDATGTNQIQTATAANATAKLKNTGGEDLDLKAGANITLSLPSFVDSPATASLSGWTFSSTDRDNLRLQLNSDHKWVAGDTFVIALMNVSASENPPFGSATQPGTIQAIVSSKGIPHTIIASTSFGLVTNLLVGTLTWSFTDPSNSWTVISGTATGSENATAVGSANFVAFGENYGYNVSVQQSDGNGDVWQLGFVFQYYNPTLAQVSAAIWNGASNKRKCSNGKYNNYCQGQATAKDGDSSTVYWGGTNAPGVPYLTVTVHFWNGTEPDLVDPVDWEHVSGDARLSTFDESTDSMTSIEQDLLFR